MDEADAKLSFGRIEVDKGEVLLSTCHAMRSRGLVSSSEFSHSPSPSLAHTMSSRRQKQRHCCTECRQAGLAEPRH